MGYDMRWSERPPGEAEAVDAIRKDFRAACDVRDALPREERGRLRKGAGDWDDPASYDGQSERFAAAQARVSALSDDMDRADTSYFRLNIFGMGRYRTLMDAIGMIFDDDDPPAWPEPEAFGITGDVHDDWKYPEYRDKDVPPLSAEVVAACEAYEAAHQEILDWHGRADTPGIPSRKFSSNDGWHVLPAECEAALRIYAARLEEWGEAKMHSLIAEHAGDGAYWAQWLAYLAGAAGHGGFEVN